jgi:hypothetical protein
MWASNKRECRHTVLLHIQKRTALYLTTDDILLIIDFESVSHVEIMTSLGAQRTEL